MTTWDLRDASCGFSSTIFNQELQALVPGSAVSNVSEAVFMQALQRTTIRASNHSVVRNYMQPFSGPQCFCQRHDATLFLLEPRTTSRRAALRAKDFSWLYCDAPGCEKARRVDLPTLRLFANRTWLEDEKDARVASFLVSFPALPRVLDTWRESSSESAVTVSSFVIQTLCEENGLLEALESEHRRALCEYVSDYCLKHSATCDPEILTYVEQAWNAEHGPSFTCSALCDCACSMPDDWAVCHGVFSLSEYRVDMPVTLAWTAEADAEEKMVNATVLNVREGEAATGAKETLVLKLANGPVSAQEVHFERSSAEAVWRCLPKPWVTDK